MAEPTLKVRFRNSQNDFHLCVDAKRSNTFTQECHNYRLSNIEDHLKMNDYQTADPCPRSEKQFARNAKRQHSSQEKGDWHQGCLLDMQGRHCPFEIQFSNVPIEWSWRQKTGRRKSFWGTQLLGKKEKTFVQFEMKVFSGGQSWSCSAHSWAPDLEQENDTSLTPRFKSKKTVGISRQDGLPQYICDIDVMNIAHFPHNNTD